MFKRNEGTMDRIIRVIIGVVMLVAYFMLPDAGYRMWLLIGIIPLATGLVGYCAIYSILGIKTGSSD